MEQESKWHVLYLRPRTEKKLAEYCTLYDLRHYLPLRSETKVYQRRKVTVQKPVFPGYFFVSFDSAGRLQVLKSNHVVRIFDVPFQRSLLHELAQVRRALRVDPTLGACSALQKGRHVRITGGPFRGIEGIIATLKANTKVCLNVDMIGQAVAVEVDRDLLELMD